jgi:hypothetical protein
VSELLRRCGWTRPGVDHLLVTVVATRLDGWRWEERGRYPKAAAALFRRAAWVLRDVSVAHPLNVRLRTALGLSAGGAEAR